jgi:hypothetical protein
MDPTIIEKSNTYPHTPIQTNFGRFMSFSKVKEVENFVKTKFEP